MNFFLKHLAAQIVIDETVPASTLYGNEEE